MPELPEVETCRRGLIPFVEGKKLKDVWVAKANYALLSPSKLIRESLEGARVDAIERRGKYLLLHLKGRGAFLVHLGMTGNLLVLAKGEAVPKHVHLKASLPKGLTLAYRDPRKFGKLKWLGDAGDERIDKLGPDGLVITGERIFTASRKRRVAIKSLLLDQKVIAGCGNIYADETLFRAGVRPMRRAEKITKREATAIADHLREVLQRAVELGGSSISDFRQPSGESGYFQIEHDVYGRTGEECRRCKTSIVRKIIGQRSSHYCPLCQKK